MPYPRTPAIVTTAALAGLLLINAQARACDNERYPCPVVAETQEPARTTTAAPPRKKAERPAKREEKATPRSAARANDEKPAAREESGDDLRRDGAENDPPKTRVAGPTPALVPWWRVERSLNDEVDRNESPVSSSAAAWLILPNPEVAADSQTAPDVTEASATDGVRVVDASEVNELDLAAPAPPAAPRWLYYLLAALSGTVAAASTVRFFWPEIRKLYGKISAKISASSLARLRTPDAATKRASGAPSVPSPAKRVADGRERARDDQSLRAAKAYPRRQPQAALPRGLLPVAGEIR
jgi:hypothetical protein